MLSGTFGEGEESLSESTVFEVCVSITCWRSRMGATEGYGDGSETIDSFLTSIPGQRRPWSCLKKLDSGLRPHSFKAG